MLYIIPAWYDNGQWSENEQKWYRPRVHTEMDDTVKQVQLFNRQSISEFRILLLSFAPNFRHFLHRQSVFHAPYWSCFDAIQCVQRKRQRLFSLHDLDFPEDIEFIYSQFAVIAILHGEKYAQIEFGEDGNLIQVDTYKHGKISTRNRYDDRGFIGSRQVFEDDRMVCEYYLDEKGVWKLCCHSDGTVEVNPQNAFYLIERAGKSQRWQFAKEHYGSLDEIIGEVLSSYLQDVEKTDIFCVAMHYLHCSVLSKVLRGRNVILSFWGSRGLPTPTPEAVGLVRHARCVIADTGDSLAGVRALYGNFYGKTVEISPYDSRVDLGTSRQISEQRILVPVDNISDDLLREIVVSTTSYMKTNSNARVHLFTRKASFETKDLLLDKVRGILSAAGLDPRIAMEQEQRSKDELLDSDASPVPTLFVVEQCVDEVSVNKCLRNQYLLVDLASTPDLFLQIECISMCIPQVVKTATHYVEDGGNGIVVSRMEQLTECLHFYLDSLGNWNAAMVRSYEMGQRFTTTGLVQRWKEVLANCGSR